MSAALAPAPAFYAANALLRERIFHVEKSLLETRDQILNVLDRELSTVRNCLASIEAGSLAPASHVSQTQPSGEMNHLLSDPPQYDMSNVIPMTAGYAGAAPLLHEAELDPKLVQATVDELNNALTAAFSQVSDL